MSGPLEATVEAAIINSIMASNPNTAIVSHSSNIFGSKNGSYSDLYTTRCGLLSFPAGSCLVRRSSLPRFQLPWHAGGFTYAKKLKRVQV